MERLPLTCPTAARSRRHHAPHHKRIKENKLRNISLFKAMDQCVEYVYILSANFTQRRRSVGGRHKPFPLDDEAHPSRPSSVCDWKCRDGHRQRHSTAPLGHRTITSPGTLKLRPARLWDLYEEGNERKRLSITASVCPSGVESERVRVRGSSSGPNRNPHLLSQPPALGPTATCCQAYARCQL
ncbi:hypothetical protein EYF80_005207 [Liparis tanakae]|uniref:Uncharacterized protein n=1 Tax=Liparis tanakae TaxID=230148 RepID=A0A4Z2J3C3_9TELE|nr:hypothetical protein EYF80_005207 [Liparis tanakae]